MDALQWPKTIWDEFSVPKGLNSCTDSEYYYEDGIDNSVETDSESDCGWKINVLLLTLSLSTVFVEQCITILVGANFRFETTTTKATTSVPCPPDISSLKLLVFFDCQPYTMVKYRTAKMSIH